MSRAATTDVNRSDSTLEPARSQYQPLPSSTVFKRDERVYLWIIVAWLCALLYFNPRLLALLTVAPNPLAGCAVIVFVLCLDSFWFYTIYHATMIVTSWRLRRSHPVELLPTTTELPPVAILYPTRNDFRPASAASCLELSYPSAHLFILDDSTLATHRQQIDRWASPHRERVTVIRRPTHTGFKAGNLNYALRQIGARYPFFAICDADGSLPPSFIHDLLPYFADPRLAFAQAAHATRPDQPEPFGRALGYMTSAHYRYYVRARDRYGFVMFYGHGALMKTSVWDAVGGFPELVTEDLAYAARARAAGYYGRYVEHVSGCEDFPPTYAQYRTRTEKWIRGTSEFLVREFPRFARSPRIPWFEKLDVLINAASHYQTTVMLAFLLVLGTLLPSYFAYFRYPGSFLLMPVPYGKSAVESLLQIRYHIFWSWDFYLMMALTIVGPMIPAMLDLRREPQRLLRYLAASQYVFLSALVADTAAVVAFLVTGNAVFRNTHDAAAEHGASAITWRSPYHPNHPVVWSTELVVGGLLVWLGWRTKNLWFLAPASALLISPLIHWVGWQRWWVRALICVPSLIGLFILTLVTLDLLTTWNAGLIR